MSDRDYEYYGERLTPRDTTIYTHTDAPEVDHVFVKYNDVVPGLAAGRVLMRAFGMDSEEFDELVLELDDLGYNHIHRQEPTLSDATMFQSMFWEDVPKEPVDWV